jgi:archaemetzincin
MREPISEALTVHVTLLPTNDTPSMAMNTLERDLRAQGFDVAVAEPIRLPGEAFDLARRQYRADRLLDVARRFDHGRVVVVTDSDLYAGSLNFVFGLAERPGRAAVVSLARLHDGADDRLCSERAIKEVVHEIGHTFGLTHCPDPRCVMSFSNSINEVDKKDRYFCPRCAPGLPEGRTAA